MPTRIAIVAAALCAALFATACASTRTGLASVNGHSLYYSCGGSGTPVVFLAGLGGDHSLWPIAERIRSSAFACTYDRWGDGNSSRPDIRTTAADDFADLHAMLAAPPFRTPVVLVGHSYGGLLAYFAARSNLPEVAGLVLVDGSHPDQRERFEALMTEEQLALFEPLANPSPSDQPRPDFFTSLGQVKDVYGPLGDLPLTVLTATNGFTENCDTLPCDQMQREWLELQSDYASLSTQSRHIELATGHYVQDDQPDVVVNEILALLGRAATPAQTAAAR